MEINIDQIAAFVTPMLDMFSEHAAEVDEFLRTHITFVPPIVIYLAIFILAAALVVHATKVAFKLAVFVVLPTIGSALLVTQVFPELQTTNVLPVAATIFAGLFILKR